MQADRPKYISCKTFLGNIDIMCAWYLKQNFAKHSHEGYGLGAIFSGAMEFNYRGENLVAYRGCVNSVNPDEPHDGHSLDSEDGWCYSMLYFEEDVFRNLYRDMTDKYRTPFLSSGVINDTEFAITISSLVRNVFSGKVDKLYAESEIIKVLSTAVERHSDKKPEKTKMYKLGNKMRRVADYINESIDQKISIIDLANIAGVSPYHFIRSFKNDKGLTPYEYVSVKRTDRAKKMILNGNKFAETAAKCGFTDQSHMNKWLKRVYGVTPKNMSSIVL